MQLSKISTLAPAQVFLQCKMRVIKPACCPGGDFEAWSCNLHKLLWSWEVLLCVKLEHDVSIDLKALYTKSFNSFQNCIHASQNYLPVHKAAMWTSGGTSAVGAKQLCSNCLTKLSRLTPARNMAVSQNGAWSSKMLNKLITRLTYVTREKLLFSLFNRFESETREEVNYLRSCEMLMWNHFFFFLLKSTSLLPFPSSYLVD